jgi:sugar/nucleoside kinase (ribokinase family)
MNVEVFTNVSRNLIAPDPFPEGTMTDPVLSEWGDGGAVVAPALHALGCQVRLRGRLAPGQDGYRELMTGRGIGWAMEAADGTGALSVVLAGRRVLRVLKAPPFVFSASEGRELAASPADAFVLTGSLDNGYAAAVLEVAAARGLPCFINPPAHFDLRMIGAGVTAFLQVNDVEFGGDGNSGAALARKLLAGSGAAGVVVTAAGRGAWGVLRGDPKVLHCPAVPGVEPVRPLGAGDAHFAGLVATLLAAPKAVRLERSLAVARLVAARHVAGLAPCGWVDLCRYEAQLDLVPPLRAVA